jgi:hypothetical protein
MIVALKADTNGWGLSFLRQRELHLAYASLVLTQG